jgi:hypothetical protein
VKHGDRRTSAGPRRTLCSSILAVLLALAFVTVVAAPSQAADPCTTGNAIACENSKPGSPSSEWEVAGGGSTTIGGFTTDISVNAGSPIQFKIHADANYTLDIYRMGYYGGSGARKITSLTPNQTVSQANLPGLCVDNSTSTGLVDCGPWGVSASWAVPATAVSGIYFAHIVRTDTGADNHVMFVVRNDASHSDMIYQTSDTTWQAYNDWGGSSLYAGQPAGRAYKVSYNRPFNTRGTPDGRDFVWANEYPMVRFLEANGYDVSYQSGIDTDRAGSLLMNHKIFMSVGHDEYWSGQQRANVEAARDAGVNLAFFSGNEVYWKTRYEASVDPAAATPYRTLVTYKETADNDRTDPLDFSSNIWTGTWRDPRFSPPADGGRPENALTGTISTVIAGTQAIKVPAADGKMRFWRGTAVGSQTAGSTYTLPMNTLGYEWDEDLDNGFRPKGLIDLSTGNYDVTQKLTDFGSVTAPGNATHHLTLYRASSGALVFGAGTVQWSWGLDSHHDGAATPTDDNMRQATVNLFADMSAQPTTLQSGLSAATKSTDVTPAVAVISSPAAGASLASGTQITVTGTATDVGGQVGGVEVSLDSGQTWHPATGRAAWSYSGIVGQVGPITIQARATDDSGNVQVAPSQRQVTVNCPCAMFAGETPAVATTTDTSQLELGLRFHSQLDGFITGVQFYKGPTTTGLHTGTLWSATGARLAVGTFTGESSSGWQTMQFPTAVPITAGTEYVASYHAPNGGYASTGEYFVGRDAIGYPLTALRSSPGALNGLFADGASSFPTSSYKGGNYWVSPIFDTSRPPDTAPPTVISVSPLPASTSVSLSVHPAVTFDEPIAAGTLALTLSSTIGLVPGSTTLNASRTVATFTPAATLTNGTTYTLATSGGTDDADNPLSPSSSTFRTVEATAPGVCPCSIWSDSDVPNIASYDDPSSVELGVRFKADQNGFVSGIRFYKGAQNVGVHTGTLWTSDGTQLATATFASESSTGWQEVRFSARIPVTAGTTYVASYHTSGYYSVSGGVHGSDVVNSPLTALASSSSAGNGMYAYGGHAFPGGNGNGTDYGVDLVFEFGTDTSPPAVASTSPGASASNVRIGTPITANFSEKVVSGLTAALKIGSSAVAATVSLDSAGRVATITPTSPLLPSTTYTVSVGGAKDAAGNAMTANYTWNFSTAGVDACPCTLYSSDRVPAVTATNDGTPLELGVRVTAAATGFITGVRFYKGAGNTGTHVGSLWTTGGSLISSAAFSSETDSGWQQVVFGSPVAVMAGSTYVASYSDPSGHYPADSNQLSAAWVNGPLTAPASVSGAGNGVYSTTPGRFPSASYNATGYGVDVTFSPGAPTDTSPPDLISLSPVNGASSVPTNQAPVALFDEAMAPASVHAGLTGPGTTVVASTVTLGADNSVTVTPTAMLANNVSYTVTISGSDQYGNAMTSPVQWSFRTAKAASSVCPCSLWTDDSAPVVASDSDDRSVEVGVKFSPDSAGKVSGLRFYKGVGNTGTHIGTLWSSTGAELAKATFTAESAAGWQEVTFAQPVNVTAGTEYVASYHADSGGFAFSLGGFANAGVSRGPLNAPIGVVGDPNGVYGYGARAFPTDGTTTNYWVDVLFTPAPPDVTPPVVSAVTATGSGTSATVTWTTNEAATSSVAYGTSATALTSTATGPGSLTAHSVNLTGLSVNTRYYYRVTSADPAANSTTSPAVTAVPAQYVPAVTPLIKTTTADFSPGTVSGTYLSSRAGGEITLAPTLAEEFSGTAVPAAWTSTSLASGSSVTVAGGIATVSGRLLRTTAGYATDRQLDVVATLKPVAGQWLGATDDDFNGSLDNWVAFRTTPTGGLVAETHNGLLGTTTTNLASTLLGASHRYQITWTATSAIFAVDGTTVATHARGVLVAMRVAAEDTTVDSSPLLLDSVWLSPYTTTGTFTSAVIDAGAQVDWKVLTPTASIPSGTTVGYEVRTGPSATAGATGWSAWTAVASGADVPGIQRYLQYRVTLGTGSPKTTAPTLSALQFAFAIP